jgi:hypothetical protein
MLKFAKDRLVMRAYDDSGDLASKMQIKNVSRKKVKERI